MPEYATRTDIGDLHERVNRVTAEIHQVAGRIGEHESACKEKWLNQAESNKVVARLDTKFNYLLGAIAVVVFLATMAGQWVAARGSDPP